jgi:hypothetical protein
VTTTTTASSISGDTGGGGLTKDQQIAIGVGLSMGLPTILYGGIKLYLKWRKNPGP